MLLRVNTRGRQVLLRVNTRGRQMLLRGTTRGGGRAVNIRGVVMVLGVQRRPRKIMGSGRARAVLGDSTRLGVVIGLSCSWMDAGVGHGCRGGGVEVAGGGGGIGGVSGGISGVSGGISGVSGGISGVSGGVVGHWRTGGRGGTVGRPYSVELGLQSAFVAS